MPKIVSKYVQVHIARINERTKSREFLALKRSPDLIVYPNLWQTITGTIEKKETAAQAALREIREETGLSIQNIRTIPYVASFYDPKSDEINLTPVFGAIVDSDAKVTLSAEHQDFKWASYEKCLKIFELPAHRLGLKYFLETVLNASNDDLFTLEI